MNLTGRESIVTLHHGDCLEVLRGMEADSVDSMVTDPPYGLSFMGKEWDYDVPSVAVWCECLRVLKHGGHLLSFAGARTYHRMAVNIEDAGFEIRDQIMWVYGSGFPKSHNISKAIDKAAGAEREVIGQAVASALSGNSKFNDADVGTISRDHNNPTQGYKMGAAGFYDITTPTTPEAQQWEGWGTALKPAHEPIVMARKPLSEKTIAKNVLEHGTGGINIDGCRIETEEDLNGGAYAKDGTERHDGAENWRYKRDGGAGNFVQPEGRFPANIILDEEAGKMLDEQSGQLKSGDMDSIAKGGQFNTYGVQQERRTTQIGDEGGASRFFYCAKASKKERNAGCEGLPLGEPPDSARSKPAEGRKNALGEPRANNHPTVKPVELMRYLVRLVTPPDGIVLDPFMGSGSTGKAAVFEGMDFIGIEKEKEYIEISRKRVENAKKVVKSENAVGAQLNLF